MGEGESDGDGFQVGASESGSVRNGTKLTVPRLKSFLWSNMVWFMAEVSVVPHQLL